MKRKIKEYEELKKELENENKKLIFKNFKSYGR